MFESIVSEVLTRFLGKYIENLNGQQLRLGVWGGDVTLLNLQFKPEALKGLNLPVAIIRGEKLLHLPSLPLQSLLSFCVCCANRNRCYWQSCVEGSMEKFGIPASSCRSRQCCFTCGS